MCLVGILLAIAKSMETIKSNTITPPAYNPSYLDALAVAQDVLEEEVPYLNDDGTYYYCNNQVGDIGFKYDKKFGTWETGEPYSYSTN